jgi:protein NUD1
LDEDESPSKTSIAGRPEVLQPLTARHPSTTPAGVSKAENAESPRRVFSRSYGHKLSPGKQGFSKANGTFLTECSFAVTHDRLVEVITDIQPFEPHWEDLGSIDLSNSKLESVARLKEFLPRLDALSL